MNEESKPPVRDVNILLLDSKKCHVCFVRKILQGNVQHEYREIKQQANSNEIFNVIFVQSKKIKMKKILALATLLSIFSCKTKDSSEKPDKDKEKTEEERTDVAPLRKNAGPEAILGSYSGSFGENEYESNKIRLIISLAENGKIEGRSIVGGNDRPFTGTYEIKDNHVMVKIGRAHV